MSLLDDELGQVAASQPPMRGLSSGLVEIRKSAPLGLHALTSKSADPDQQTNEEAIPAPPEPLIHELTTTEATLLIERHIEFFSVDKFGAIRTVRLRSVFVSAYRSLHHSKLPVVVAVSTAPFVSPVSGAPIAGVGLDRDARIFYRIEPALLQCVSDPATITDQQAIDAYNFLANEWLVDVTTDADGKAVAIAAAQTMIQRIALEQRPAFFLVAAQRGGGKTTLASMITTAALGRPPAAAAWASNEDERRKALLSHLRVGAACIVWDNIPRGAFIKCSHTERALHLGGIYRSRSRRFRTAHSGITHRDAVHREQHRSIHDVPLPSGPLPNRRVGQILVKAANRPVRAGERIVRLRPVHKGDAGRTYQLEALGRPALWISSAKTRRRTP